MNILYIASVRIPNEKASGLAIMRQCEAFAELGHQVTLLRPHRTNHIADNPFLYYGIAPSFRIETMPSIDFKQKLGIIGFAIARISQMVASFLYWLKNRHRVDVVYARDPWMLMLMCMVPSKKRKVIWEAHQAQRGFVIRYVAKRVSNLVCISQGLKQHLTLLSGRTDIAVEPSGVHLSQFEQLPPQEEVRKKFGLPRTGKIIGYIGKYKTMGEEKGVDDLIHACARVREERSDAHLLIVGLEQGEEDTVKNLCTGAGLPEGSFTLLPLVQRDFAEYIHAADVLVMNYPDTEHYRNYMSPTKLFAYMASGKIIVVSNLPSIKEIVDESMVYFVVPSDILFLALTLSRTLRNENNPSSKTERAMQKVKTFEWKSRAKRLLGQHSKEK